MRFVLSVLLLLGLSLPVWADGPVDEKPTRREREILKERPSGFWTSNKPAEHGAYRWRLMAVGGGLLLITGFAMVKLVKRANAHRKDPPPMPWDKPKRDEPA